MSSKPTYFSNLRNLHILRSIGTLFHVGILLEVIYLKTYILSKFSYAEVSMLNQIGIIQKCEMR